MQRRNGDKMREKGRMTASLALTGLLVVLIIAAMVFNGRGMGNKTIRNIENSRESDNNREIEMPFADEKAYEVLQEVYREIDFHGEFKKGNEEVYDYYKNKYAKLLNGEVKITDDFEEEYSWEAYGHDLQELTSIASAKLYYFDMDEDSLPELCIAGESGTHVFKYIPETDQYKIWREVLKPGGNITGSGKIKTGSSYIIDEGSAYAFYSFSQLNKSGYLDYRVGFGIDYYESTPIYMVSWPLYENETKKIEMPKELKQQRYTRGGPDSDWDGYYFRVTKEQYEQLTEEFFKADILSQWERVPVSYFLTELEGVYGSFREFPFNMPYAGESAFQMLEKSYEGINFHGEFERGDKRAYKDYLEKYAQLINGEAGYTYGNGNGFGFTQEEYINYLEQLKDIYAEFSEYEEEFTYNSSEEEYIPEGYIDDLNDKSTKLYYFDFDGDSLPEVCIENLYRTEVYKYISDTDQFQLWWEAWDFGYKIAGKRQIRRNGDFFYEFYKLKEDGTEDFNIMFGVINMGRELEKLYIASFPCYKDKAVNPQIPEAMKKQGFISSQHWNYFFRITKEQYEKLTKEYFMTNMEAVWRRIPLSYFSLEE